MAHLPSELEALSLLRQGAIVFLEASAELPLDDPRRAIRYFARCLLDAIDTNYADTARGLVPSVRRSTQGV